MFECLLTKGEVVIIRARDLLARAVLLVWLLIHQSLRVVGHLRDLMLRLG